MSFSFLNDIDMIKSAVLGVVTGIALFLKGFKELKSKRTIQNIPTSKISTGAVGTNVEISGAIVVEDSHLETAPISGKKCVLYHIQIEESGYGNNSWEIIDEYFSDDGFFLDDKSGASALVLLENAEFHHTEEPVTIQLGSYEFPTFPEALKQSLLAHQHKIKNYELEDSSSFTSNEVRFSEWYFMPEEEIYVLGFAESGMGMGNTQSPDTQNVKKAEKEIKSDSTLRDRFDSNKNGKLDEAEFEQGANILSKRLAGKYTKEKVETLLPLTKLVFKHTEPFPFIVSKHSERNLTKRLGKGAVTKIWGGPVLTLASLAYLLFAYFQ